MIIAPKGADYSARNLGKYVPMRSGMPADGLDALYLMMDGVTGYDYPTAIRDWSGKKNDAVLRTGYTSAKQGVDGLECASQHGSVYISPLPVKRQQTTIVVGALHPDAAEVSFGLGSFGINFSSFTKVPGNLWDSDPTNANPALPYPYLSFFRLDPVPIPNRSTVNAYLHQSVSGVSSNLDTGSYRVGPAFVSAFAVDMETGLIRTNGSRPPNSSEAIRTPFADRMALDGYDVGNHQIGVYPNGSNYRPITSYLGKVYLHAVYEYVMTTTQMAAHIAMARAIVAARGVVFDIA